MLGIKIKKCKKIKIEVGTKVKPLFSDIVYTVNSYNKIDKIYSIKDKSGEIYEGYTLELMEKYIIEKYWEIID